MIKENNLDIAVLALDYRGFSISDGNPSAEDLIADLIIAEDRIGRRFENLYIYAQSFGVLLTLNAFDGLVNVDKIVLDSIAATTPWVLGCPSSVQPINNVPQDASKIMYLYGLRDTQVSVKSAERLASSIRANGGSALGVDGGHPSNSYEEFSARVQPMIVFFGLRK